MAAYRSPRVLGLQSVTALIRLNCHCSSAAKLHRFTVAIHNAICLFNNQQVESSFLFALSDPHKAGCLFKVSCANVGLSRKLIRIRKHSRIPRIYHNELLLIHHFHAIISFLYPFLSVLIWIFSWQQSTALLTYARTLLSCCRQYQHRNSLFFRLSDSHFSSNIVDCKNKRYKLLGNNINNGIIFKPDGHDFDIYFNRKKY